MCLYDTKHTLCFEFMYYFGNMHALTEPSGHNQTQTYNFNEVGVFFIEIDIINIRKSSRRRRNLIKVFCWLIHLNNDFAAMAAFPEQVYFGLMPNITKTKKKMSM